MENEIYFMNELYFGKTDFDWVKHIIVKTSKTAKDDVWFMNVLQSRTLDEYNRYAGIEVNTKYIEKLEDTINNFKMGNLFLTRSKFNYKGKEIDAPLLVVWDRWPQNAATHPILHHTITDIDREHMIPLKDIVKLDKITKLTPSMYAKLVKEISTKKFAQKFNDYIKGIEQGKANIENAKSQVEVHKQNHKNHKESFEKIEL